jgi:hypothetical protein
VDFVARRVVCRPFFDISPAFFLIPSAGSVFTPLLFYLKQENPETLDSPELHQKHGNKTKQKISGGR